MRAAPMVPRLITLSVPDTLAYLCLSKCFRCTLESSSRRDALRALVLQRRCPKDSLEKK